MCHSIILGHTYVDVKVKRSFFIREHRRGKKKR